VDFCPHCGAPLSGFSTIDPYKRIAAQGQMYWRLTHEPMSPIVLVGLSLMFGTSLLIGVGVVMQALRDTNTDWTQRVLYIVMGGASAALSIAFWYRVYQNFRRHAKRGKS
jgi:uncharacterized membrane protein YdcZ (DUF606 family)